MSTFEETDTVVTPPVGQFERKEARGDSLVDLIQKDLEEQAAIKDVFIPVTGYDTSGLAIKYRMPKNGKELDGVAEKVERQKHDRYYTNLWTAVDTMILLCDGLFVKPEGVEEYVMLDPEDSGTPVHLGDARLAEIVGLTDEPAARKVVQKLFNKQDVAIINHFERLSRWLGNTKADLEREFWQTGK